MQKTRNINRRLRQIEKAFPGIVRQAGAHFKGVTPKRSGNARRNTTLVGNEIQANYNYANRLNAGWSRQAPDGMTKSTIALIRRLIRKI